MPKFHRTTPFTFLKASYFPFSLSPVCLWVKALTLWSDSDDACGVTPFFEASWKHYWLPMGIAPPLSPGPSGGRQLTSGRSCFCACLCLIASISFRLHWSSSGRCFAVLLHGGRFATVVALVVDRFGRMLCRLGLSVRWMLCHLRARRPYAFLAMVYLFSRFSCLVGSRFMGS